MLTSVKYELGDADSIADILRIEYISRVRARGGVWSRYLPSSVHAKVWLKAASICLNHELDPIAHVRALVEMMRNPYPNQLLGDKAIRRTRTFIGRSLCDARLLVQAQLSRLIGCLNVGENVVTLLTCQGDSLCAALKYYVAARVGLPALASQYRDEARREFLMKPELLKCLGDILPEAFVKVLNDVDCRRTAVIDYSSDSRFENYSSG